MFESRHQQLLPPRKFFRRIGVSLACAAVILGIALTVGIIGFHWFAGFSWIDSLLNAAMLLGGMGEVTELKSDAGKLFASFYALFGGIVFISVMAVLLAPVMHRILHNFHIDEADLAEKNKR